MRPATTEVFDLSRIDRLEKALRKVISIAEGKRGRRRRRIAKVARRALAPGRARMAHEMLLAAREARTHPDDLGRAE